MSEKHQDVVFYCLVTIAGNVLPLLLGMLFYAANEWEGWNVFYRDGQFYLYSASMLAASAYIFFTHKVFNTDRISWFFMITAFLMLGVSALYGFILSNSNNNLVFVKWTSIAVFVITLIIYYYSNYFQNEKVDVIEARRRDIASITDNLPQV